MLNIQLTKWRGCSSRLPSPLRSIETVQRCVASSNLAPVTLEDAQIGMSRQSA